MKVTIQYADSDLNIENYEVELDLSDEQARDYTIEE